MPGKLEDRVSIVTGAGPGICRETAILFAQEGSSVVLADIDRQAGEETARMIESSGGRATFVETDVARSPQVRRLVHAAIETYGGVDVLVNGAARQATTPHLAEVTEAEWDLVMGVNIKGVFLCSKEAIPAMLRGGGGAIVNVGSAVTLAGDTFSVPYAVSKAGVAQLTRVANSQYASKGIRVNCLLPGLIDTPASQSIEGRLGIFDEFVSTIPIGRAGLPADVANLTLFLASDDSSFIAGACIVIDGGRDSR